MYVKVCVCVFTDDKFLSCCLLTSFLCVRHPVMPGYMVGTSEVVTCYQMHGRTMLQWPLSTHQPSPSPCTLVCWRVCDGGGWRGLSSLDTMARCLVVMSWRADWPRVPLIMAQAYSAERELPLLSPRGRSVWRRLHWLSTPPVC